MPTVVEEALEYASLGWHLLPGKDKVPYVKWSEASNDPIKVHKFFEQYPMAEILVLCGPSGLGVLDVDIYKAPIEERLPHFDTWAAETPKGGMQYIFADPDSAVPTTAGKINPWTDTRGVGGLIVLPSANSPKRRWVKKPPMKRWPTEAFPNLGTPRTAPPIHSDENGTWQPVVGERLPNENCPGSYHLTTGRQPRLGVVRYPNGHIEAKCWSGCSSEEVYPLLIEAGRYTAEELGISSNVSDSERLGRFITRDELMAIQPPVWMIEPYLQENALIMLAAKFNTGKTFLAVNWSLELAAQQRRVLYIALEGLTGLQSRVRAWEEHYETTTASGILFSPRGYSLNLLSERSVSTLCADLEAEGGFDLVVVDNLGEALPGDENDSEAVGRAMYALNQIRAASGGAVLDLHNSGHGGQVRARGHSKMLDVHDTVIYLEAIEGSINGLKVISGKERNAERFVTRRAHLKKVGDSLVAILGGKAVAEADPTYNAIKLGHDTIKKVATYLELTPTTAARRVKELQEKGDIGELPVQGKEKRYETLWDKPI